MNSLVNVVSVFSCRQAKESPSLSPHCLTLRGTSSSSDTVGTLDMSLGLCSETACSPVPSLQNVLEVHWQAVLISSFHQFVLQHGWKKNSSSEQHKGWRLVCLSWTNVSRLLGVVRRRFSDLYLNCFSITTHGGVSPHNTVQTGAASRGDAHSIRRPLNIFFFFFCACFIVGDFAEYWGDISFIMELSREEMHPVCFCCCLTK